MSSLVDHHSSRRFWRTSHSTWIGDYVRDLAPSTHHLVCGQVVERGPRSACLDRRPHARRACHRPGASRFAVGAPCMIVWARAKLTAPSPADAMSKSVSHISSEPPARVRPVCGTTRRSGSASRRIPAPLCHGVESRPLPPSRRPRRRRFVWSPICAAGCPRLIVVGFPCGLAANQDAGA
jgi:hypothetical protein